MQVVKLAVSLTSEPTETVVDMSPPPQEVNASNDNV